MEVTTNEFKCYIISFDMLVDKQPKACESGGWIWVNDPSYYQAHPSTARNDAEANVSVTKEDYREAASRGIQPSQSLIIDLSKKHQVQSAGK